MSAVLAPGWFYRADFTRDPLVEAARVLRSKEAS